MDCFASLAMTNVLVYTATSDARKQRAVECLGRSGWVSVQVLNEFIHVARRKLRHDWPQIELALGLLRASLDDVVPVTLNTHIGAVSLAREHGLSFYDALIVAAAVEAGCDTLYSEDMQHGRTIGGLTIVNPFLDSAP
jgi:predicted nucleic acid-binding protein